MLSGSGAIMVGHRRAPVLRMIRSNLMSRGYHVITSESAAECTAALRALPLAAMVVDVGLLSDDCARGDLLRAELHRTALPVLLVSFEPSDHVLARAFPTARFLNRVDDIDDVVLAVERLTRRSVPV